MYKTIVIPTDGTEFCEKAIHHGIGLAKMTGAKIVAITVIPPLHLSMPSGMIPMEIKGMIKTEREQMAVERLKAVTDAASAQGIKAVAVSKASDTPWAGIVETAAEHKADLIVMASHGRRGLSAMLLGSETQKVLVHSKVPVLVVK